jgi:hypothetical protein
VPNAGWNASTAALAHATPARQVRDLLPDLC